MQFGLLIPGGPKWMPGTSRETYVADTRRVLDRIEGVFDSVWMVDHFWINELDCFECWTTLSFFAGLYPGLRFGSMVLCNSFRNPGLLAKMAATLQCLTDGRLILGIGAGWNEAEYRAFGYDFPGAGTRIDQLDEALQVITSLWHEPSSTFAGRHYQLVDARCDPKPPLPPTLLVGGRGRRTIQLAARYADWWNADWVSADMYRELSQQVTSACVSEGREPAALRRTWLGLCSCAPTLEAAQDAMAGGVPERPGNALVGTPSQIVDGLAPFVDAGMDYWIMTPPRVPDAAALDVLTDELLPQVRARYAG